jgi:hypothetical protein
MNTPQELSLHQNLSKENDVSKSITHGAILNAVTAHTQQHVTRYTVTHKTHAPCCIITLSQTQFVAILYVAAAINDPVTDSCGERTPENYGILHSSLWQLSKRKRIQSPVSGYGSMP